MQYDVDAIIDYMSSLRITQGDGVGDLLEVLPWQRDWVREILADDADPVSALSISRGAGKTTITAALMAAFLDGPAAKPGTEIIIVGPSFAQAKLAFRHVRGFMEARYSGLGAEWRCNDNTNDSSIANTRTNIRLRGIASDPRRAHGLNCRMIAYDEPAQSIENAGERMFQILRASLGKTSGARMLLIGTRPAHSNHFFQRVLDTNPVSRTYAAGKDDDPMAEATWHMANPSLRYFPVLMEATRREAKDCERDPQMLPAFRSMRLNSGESEITENYVLETSTWEQCEVEELPARAGGFVLGVDLGGSAAMSAAAAFWPRTGALQVRAAFSAKPSIEQRMQHDGEPAYRAMLDRGELRIAGANTVDVKAFLAECLGKWGTPKVIVADRFRQAELFDLLDSMHIPRTLFEARGLGWRDGGEDTLAFQRAALDGKIRVEKSLLMRAGIAVARLLYSPSGSAKLAKRREGGRSTTARDDAVNAAILAVAGGLRHYGPGKAIPPSGRRRRTRLVVCG